MFDMSRIKPEPMPGYAGPIRYIEPTTGRGRVDMFCPGCGCTSIETLDARRGMRRCRGCGRRFRLDPAVNDAKEFTVYSRDCNRADRCEQDGIDLSIYSVAEYDYCDCQDYLYNLASSYYGPEFTEFFDGYYTERKYPYEDEETVDLLAWDQLAAEVNHMVDEGYIGGLEVGEYANIPGTPIRVTRTKNLKSGRAGRCAFGRRRAR